jgi:hypothetical protein
MMIRSGESTQKKAAPKKEQPVGPLILQGLQPDGIQIEGLARKTALSYTLMT